MDTVSPFLQPLPLFFVITTSLLCRMNSLSSNLLQGVVFYLRLSAHLFVAHYQLSRAVKVNIHLQLRSHLGSQPHVLGNHAGMINSGSLNHPDQSCNRWLCRYYNLHLQRRSMHLATIINKHYANLASYCVSQLLRHSLWQNKRAWSSKLARPTTQKTGPKAMDNRNRPGQARGGPLGTHWTSIAGSRAPAIFRLISYSISLLSRNQQSLTFPQCLFCSFHRRRRGVKGICSWGDFLSNVFVEAKLLFMRLLLENHAAVFFASLLSAASLSGDNIVWICSWTPSIATSRRLNSAFVTGELEAAVFSSSAMPRCLGDGARWRNRR